MYIQLDSAADEVLSQTIEELALRLPHAEHLFRKHMLQELETCTTAISTLACRIGMAKLGRVAHDVRLCCDSRDQAALAATLSRMIRLGHGSLQEIWALQELPI